MSKYQHTGGIRLLAHVMAQNDKAREKVNLDTFFTGRMHILQREDKLLYCVKLNPKLHEIINQK